MYSNRFEYDGASQTLWITVLVSMGAFLVSVLFYYIQDSCTNYWRYKYNQSPNKDNAGRWMKSYKNAIKHFLVYVILRHNDKFVEEVKLDNKVMTEQFERTLDYALDLVQDYKYYGTDIVDAFELVEDEIKEVLYEIMRIARSQKEILKRNLCLPTITLFSFIQ
ncbi:unnamed protein product [Bursaphelenchus okinawaensis]|uniref:Uncharacterized protein n=1 Tax=Bursaphelenchus okinawaensis TaxID=465554 RepID=A0A811KAG3_9BILA|nr:unnamed protein product [Bursaphelenchus okinawaensis]CAG9097449.1 unnamed protein product [Bursaphelenchus okinawaensis]